MCRRFVLVLAVATLGLASGAQSASNLGEATGPSTALRPNARSTELSVVVQDREGHPVRGLKPENFRVTESGVPQTIARLEEHSSQSPTAPAPAFPSLPPDTFTNYTPIAPGETLNILLIDALNTPLKDESFIRSQLRQYVRQANPNTRIAVLGLANHLILLQGFSSDPSALRDVVERKLIARVPASSEASPTIKGGPSAISVAANLRAFEEQLGDLETGFRVQYTLDAFNTLAHYLAGFPGRKNLIWFSGSFPFNVVPDPSLPHPFEVADADAAELRETVKLLSKAQVAVYPVDARGLVAASANGAARGGQAHGPGIDLSKSVQSQAAEHAMMEAIAASTGGRAIYNPESLADAVNKAVAAGSSYYTLSYIPNPEDEGSYRPIRVDITGADGEQHLQVSYQRGDYSSAATVYQANESTSSSAIKAEPGRAAAYEHAAMSRGAPTPEDLLFRVRVLPASTTTETAPAPGDELAPVMPSKGPFRRYELDFLSLPGQLIFTQQPDGRRVAKVEFLAYVFDTKGYLLATAGRQLTLEPRTNDESRLAHTLIEAHLEISVPDRAETFLRIGVRDVTSNKLGVIEIPTSALTSLPPATNAPASPAGSKPLPAPPSPTGRSTPPQV
jgi:VWFA-related protein